MDITAGGSGGVVTTFVGGSGIDGLATSAPFG